MGNVVIPRMVVGLTLLVAVLSLVIAVSVLWLLGHPPAPGKSDPITWYARHLTPQTGIASWYGPRFQGRRTANGERFDQNGMTAAHRTFRFGTFVVVTRPNGRSVKVRINDRGPFIKGRIIDVSRAAAVELGMKKTGLAKVTVTHQ